MMPESPTPDGFIDEVRSEVRRELALDAHDEAPHEHTVGGSGVGKSTILRLILRLIMPDRGEILLAGRDICTVSFDDVLELRQNMGMVFQASALFDSMNVFDNVAFPLLEHTTLSDEEIRERVIEVLSFVDLKPKEVLDLLPRYLCKEGVVALGEIGFDDMTEQEEKVFHAQLEMVEDTDLPV